MIKKFEFLSFFVYFVKKNVSIKSVFNVWNGHYSEFKSKLLQKFEPWRTLKSGGQMTLMENVSDLTCIKTQKVQ